MQEDNEQPIDPEFEKQLKEAFQSVKQANPQPMSLVLQELVKERCEIIQDKKQTGFIPRVIAFAAMLLICSGLFIAYQSSYHASQDETQQSNPLEKKLSQPQTIVDAYRLALLLESNQAPSDQYDINQDGLINTLDVETIALNSVSVDSL